MKIKAMKSQKGEALHDIYLFIGVLFEWFNVNDLMWLSFRFYALLCSRVKGSFPGIFRSKFFFSLPISPNFAENRKNGTVFAPFVGAAGV